MLTVQFGSMILKSPIIVPVGDFFDEFTVQNESTVLKRHDLFTFGGVLAEFDPKSGIPGEL